MFGNILRNSIPCISNITSTGFPRTFCTTQSLCEIRKLARMRVVDNSAIGRAAAAAGRPARVIQVYNKKGVGMIGDKILVAIKGQKKKAYIVGLKQTQKPLMPRFDTNNIVLVEDNNSPTGTRIRVPIPSQLRGQGKEFTKILAIASKFV
ncbi:39S ribosomal protein L14, mitochondrial [Octopus bimaculoides]|uniref:Large ribosomal subunit protein uL14m n=1 Tax=Octopus bimaculoides TaxID=37653 RepID=A0A0L8G149_OCTBM|nr:39S ribosomal protein L14, mitochondrial [Octopus bimaculoides]|eukprot:XP_014785025.1 PREDICTED: 39S ribosomal protein L14, mitochondrial-like [Octopus bimaculoides]